MANVLVNETSLQNIANSIRAKNGSSDTYTPAEMSSAIDNIPSGGGIPSSITDYITSGTTINRGFVRFINGIGITSPITWNVDSAAYLFYYCILDQNMIDNIKINVTSRTTRLEYLYGNTVITTGFKIPSYFANWNTSNVTDLSYLFYTSNSSGNNNYIYGLNYIKDWNTSKVTNFSRVFYGRSVYIYADSAGTNRDIVLNWDVSKAAQLAYFFYSSSYNTTNPSTVKNFNTFSGLYTTYTSAEDNSTKCACNYMFSNLESAKVIDLQNVKLQISQVNYMFQNCASLTKIDIRGLKCSEITSSSYYTSALNKVPTTVKIIVRDTTEKSWWQGKFSGWSRCFYTVTEAINAGYITNNTGSQTKGPSDNLTYEISDDEKTITINETKETIKVGLKRTEFMEV